MAKAPHLVRGDVLQCQRLEPQAGTVGGPPSPFGLRRPVLFCLVMNKGDNALLRLRNSPAHVTTRPACAVANFAFFCGGQNPHKASASIRLVVASNIPYARPVNTRDRRKSSTSNRDRKT